MSRFIVITCHFQTALLSPFYLAVTDKRVVMLSDAFPRLPRPRRRVHQEIYRVEWPVMSITVLTLYSPLNLLKNRVEHSFAQSYESSEEDFAPYSYYSPIYLLWESFLQVFAQKIFESYDYRSFNFFSDYSFVRFVYNFIQIYFQFGNTRGWIINKFVCNST